MSSSRAAGLRPSRPLGRRAFLGNSGITQPGRRVPDDGLVAVLSATPHKAKAGSSWLGSPPVRLRRQPTAADVLRTFHPSLRLKLLRAMVETCRVGPLIVTFAIGVAVLFAVLVGFGRDVRKETATEGRS